MYSLIEAIYIFKRKAIFPLLNVICACGMLENNAAQSKFSARAQKERTFHLFRRFSCNCTQLQFFIYTIKLIEAVSQNIAQFK